jgi:hypothetical protein
MTTATFSEAARALGFRSRSTLFRLKDSGDLTDYLRPPSSPGGAQLLELEPRGLPPLREAVARLIRPQANNCERYRRPRIDPRWGTVAGVLSEALADHGGLSLCDSEAAAIAGALPAALGEAFGAQGLELLRVGLADAGYGWRVGPGTPEHPEHHREWWGDDGWGRWEPGEPLEDGPFWESVGGIVGGFLGGPFEQLTGPQARDLHFQLGEAFAAVEAGARWDPRNWAAASALSLIDDPSVSDDLCPHSRPELERLAAGGLLSPELQARVNAVLQRYRENDQQAAQSAPLPVAVS